MAMEAKSTWILFWCGKRAPIDHAPLYLVLDLQHVDSAFFGVGQGHGEDDQTIPGTTFRISGSLSVAGEMNFESVDANGLATQYLGDPPPFGLLPHRRGMRLAMVWAAVKKWFRGRKSFTQQGAISGAWQHDGTIDGFFIMCNIVLGKDRIKATVEKWSKWVTGYFIGILLRNGRKAARRIILRELGKTVAVLVALWVSLIALAAIGAPEEYLQGHLNSSPPKGK